MPSFQSLPVKPSHCSNSLHLICSFLVLFCFVTLRHLLCTGHEHLHMDNITNLCFQRKICTQKSTRENHKILYFYKNKIYMWRFLFRLRILSRRSVL